MSVYGVAAARWSILGGTALVRLGRRSVTDCSDESGKGTTRWAGVVGFRPAFVNWRTTEADTELVLETVRGLGARVLTRAGGG